MTFMFPLPHFELHFVAMSEKLCLQWNGFKENVNSLLGQFRGAKEFTDVTLACEDGQEIESHKVILAASSPFFEKILQKSKHPHPLIYLRGFRSKDFQSILDFLYFGEANVFQEDLDSFLAIAEEIQLKGQTGQTSADLLAEQEEALLEAKPKSKDLVEKSTTHQPDMTDKRKIQGRSSAVAAIPNASSSDIQALDEKVKSMMERGQKMIPGGKQARQSQRPKQETSSICKVCGKEGRSGDIKKHIEANHIEGVSLPCEFCSNTFQTRNALRLHIRMNHK